MWHVQVDHKIFDELNSAQWLWYFNNFMKDREEEFISRRDLVEYLASFIEPEAVRKIKQAREKAVQVSDKDFSFGIEKMFGRKISSEKRDATEMHNIDLTNNIMEYKFYKEKSNSKSNFKDWLYFDLENN